MENINNNKIKKCLKSYLCGKKYINKNSNIALEYFKQSSCLINSIKKNNNGVIDKLLEETENACNQQLTNTLEMTIEQYIEPNKKNLLAKYTDNNNHDNELYNVIDMGDIKQLTINNYNEKDFYINNSDGLTPLHYAIKCGDTKVLKIAFSVGAHIDCPDTRFGHTLLEYAGLSGDPNMINFLESNGANVHKHINFRESVKYFNQVKEIDNALIMKLVLISKPLDDKSLDFIFKYIDINEMIGLNNITIKEFLLHLQSFISSLVSKDVFIDIIKEELKYSLQNKLGCPSNLLQLILYNLVPFMDYKYNLSLRWLLDLEIKYNIFKILKTTNIKNIKKKLINKVNKSYIKSNILTKEYLDNILSQWLIKINI
jgi:hypothetical protein